MQGQHRRARGARDRRPDGDVHAVPRAARRRSCGASWPTSSPASRWSACARARTRSSIPTGSPHAGSERRLRTRDVRAEVDHAPRPPVEHRRRDRRRQAASIRSCAASRRSMRTSWLYHVAPLAGERQHRAARGHERQLEPPRSASPSIRRRSRWHGRASTRARRVFFTTLGHPADFEQPSMRRLLVNGIYWALGRDVPAARREGRHRRTLYRAGVVRSRARRGRKRPSLEAARTRGGKPWLIAHRGASAYAPENTVPAFRLAAEQGAAFVEFDLQLTKDGQLVALHDNSLERTTDVEERVPEALPRGDVRRCEGAPGWMLEDFTLAGSAASSTPGAWFGEKFRGTKRADVCRDHRRAARPRRSLHRDQVARALPGDRAQDPRRAEGEGARQPGADPKTPVLLQSFSAPSLKIFSQTLGTTSAGALPRRPRATRRRGLTAEAPDAGQGVCHRSQPRKDDRPRRPARSRRPRPRRWACW